jgi:hypothetical protein
MRKTIKNFLTVGACLAFSGCATAGNLLNPFHEAPPPEAYLGQRNDHALNEGSTKTENARSALEAMASYRRAHAPAPYDPVVQPAVIRLMWVPDHLNRNGDLVPAHYYYLKVLNDRWAVQDAFELEKQLGPSKRSSNIPFVPEGTK